MCHRLFILVASVASVASLSLGTGCVDDDEDNELSQDQRDPSAEAKLSATALSSSDAAIASPGQPVPAAPLTGMHLDSATSSYRPSGYPPRPLLPHRSQGKTVELVLRSTPPGAVASIDGKAIGTTPTFWQGIADGRAHEYTFTKKGYSMARYRFVVTQSGVVHGSLAALVITSEPEDDTGDTAP